MKDFWTKNRTLLFSFIYLSIFFAIILIIIYSIDRSYFIGYVARILPNTTYSSSDWMGFLGSLGGGIFGAIIAITGVYMTIEYNRKETKAILDHNRDMNERTIRENQLLSDEDARKSIMPVISINKLLTKYEGNFIASFIADNTADETEPDLIPVENNIKYMEYEIESLYFTIKRNRIDISSELDRDQQKSIKEKWKQGIQFGDNQTSVINFSYVPCFVTNCGNGAAVNTIFKLKKEKDDDYEEIISEPVNLKKDADFRIGFYCFLSEETYGKYLLNIEYYDIHGEMYSQIHLLTIDHQKATITSKISQTYHKRT